MLEANLRSAASGGSLLDFTVTYSDMHGLWGGTSVSLTGAGAYERAEQPRGAPAPTVVRRAVDERRVREVAALLVAIEAWEQYTPERTPLPDESRATLAVRCGGAESAIWEDYNELGRNGRLIRVRDHLRALGDPPTAGGGPS